MEIIAVIFSLLSVWLTSKNNIWCWPIGIVGVLGFAYLFYTKGEWGNLTLQFIFLVQSIDGWLNWNKPSTKVSKIRKDELYSHIMGLIVLGTVISLITTISGSTHIVLDTITTTLSIAGMFLLIHKKLEAWYLWLVADILYVVLFLQNELYISSLVYFVFAILAYFGYKNWKKQLKNGI